MYQVELTGEVTVVWVIAKRADSEVYELAVARLQIAAGLDDQVRTGLEGILADVFQRK